MITQPILPPREGYVERVTETGEHIYVRVETEATRRLTDLESENDLLKQQLKAASDQNDFLEDCIAEMAEIVYA